MRMNEKNFFEIVFENFIYNLQVISTKTRLTGLCSVNSHQVTMYGKNLANAIEAFMC